MSQPRIAIETALQTLAAMRSDDQIVVTNQVSARLWPAVSDHALDFNYNPSSMGGAVPLGLGLALAQGQRDVWVLSGDGSLLMSLGCLVTVIGSGVANLTIVLLDNGIYEVTGGQKTPASGTGVDFAGLARAAGFPNVSHFWDAADLQRRGPQMLAARGPRFMWLEVAPAQGEVPREASRPIQDQVARLRNQLA